MVGKTMRRRSCGLLIVAIVVGSLSFATQAEPQGEAESPHDGKLRALLVQRRDVLKRRYEMMKVRLKLPSGTTGVALEDCIAAHNQFLMAELEMSSDRQQRLELLQKRIDNFRGLERQAEVRVRRGLQGDASLEEAARLQAEIDFVREQARDN